MTSFSESTATTAFQTDPAVMESISILKQRVFGNMNYTPVELIGVLDHLCPPNHSEGMSLEDLNACVKRLPLTSYSSGLLDAWCGSVDAVSPGNFISCTIFAMGSKLNVHDHYAAVAQCICETVIPIMKYVNTSVLSTINTKKSCYVALANQTRMCKLSLATNQDAGAGAAQAGGLPKSWCNTIIEAIRRALFTLENRIKTLDAIGELVAGESEGVSIIRKILGYIEKALATPAVYDDHAFRVLFGKRLALIFSERASQIETTSLAHLQDKKCKTYFESADPHGHHPKLTLLSVLVGDLEQMLYKKERKYASEVFSQQVCDTISLTISPPAEEPLPALDPETIDMAMATAISIEAEEALKATESPNHFVTSFGEVWSYDELKSDEEMRAFYGVEEDIAPMEVGNDSYWM